MPVSKDKRTKAQLIKALAEAEAERDSACASFSEALRQSHEAMDKDVSKIWQANYEMMNKRFVDLREASMQLAKYARALEHTPPGEAVGHWITRVEKMCGIVND